MFAFILIGYSVLYVSGTSDILATLWETDALAGGTISGKSLSPVEENAVVQRLSMIPFTEMLKYDAWSKLWKENQVQKFTPEEWNRFECLIPQLPISLLEKVNMNDSILMSYFGQVKLSKPQLTKLAEDVLSQNPGVVEDEEKLSRMGNIVCGFNSKGIQTIKEPVLRSLMETDFFQKIKSCDVEQLRDLLKTVEKHTVVGPPRTWQPKTVKQAGLLVSGLTAAGIREIQEKSFSHISSEVIKSTPVEVLRAMRNSQLKTLSKPALLAWRRKTQDMRPLYGNSSTSPEISLSSATFAVILSYYLHFSFI